jgi:chemotaxis protein methyltransferase CheR
MTFSVEIYKYLANLIFQHSGIVYDEKEFFRLDSRIQTLMKEFKLENEKELFVAFKASTSKEILNRVLDLSTNNETYFFRDQKPFQTVINTLIPNLKVLNRPLKIWCAGCSAGQEPYSLAMSLMDKCPTVDFSIWATDISLGILEKAKKGTYSKLEVSRGLDSYHIDKFFEKQDDMYWTIKNQIKSKIKFEFFNLMNGSFPHNDFDIIFCRNVLIYQNFANREKIMKKLGLALKESGYLFLGSGESIIGMDIDMKMMMLDGTMVFVRQTHMMKNVA